jgi:UDP-galactopyranose mutase
MPDLLVVGSGLFGLTIARLAAEQLNIDIEVIDRRGHIGGNAYSEFHSYSGIEVHKYGSHLFHTSNEMVWEFVNRFTSFTNYQHRVWTTHKSGVYPLPINLATINQYFGDKFNPVEAAKLLKTQTQSIDATYATNLEEKAIGLIGEPLYRAFIEGYTSKQWQVSPKQLPPDIITRLPIRFNYDHRYFSDKYEGLPVTGYGKWLANLADHKRIHISLGVDFFSVKERYRGAVPIVFTGAIDEYFNREFGALSWRTLDFIESVENVDDFQGTSVMNYADLDVPYTRIHEFKHLHPEREYPRDITIIAKEFSRFAEKDDEPYYPINTQEDRELLARYRELAKEEKGVFFGGRLGSYKYLDMHMAIASAHVLFTQKLKELFK